MKKAICVCCITICCVTALYANPNLIGAWTATVEQNRSFDTYRITFTDDGRCTVSVSNDTAGQETAGNWSWDGSLFRLNAVFSSARLAYLPAIQWTSVLNFTADHNSFNILGRTAANGSPARITFFRNDGGPDLPIVSNDRSPAITFNDRAIPQIFDALSARIPERSRLAITGITSPDPNEGDYYVNELTVRFVNSGKYTIVDRKDVDSVFAEQNFQMSGFVDDDAFVSIGRFFGAAVVVTGSINGTGAQKRLVVKAINVLTSEILSMVSVSL